MEARVSAHVGLLLAIFGRRSAIDIPGLKGVLDELLSTLPPIERTVLDLRFGLSSDSLLTHTEIAGHLKTTPKRVDKHITRALRKLRHPSRSRKLIRFINAITQEEVDEEGVNRYYMSTEHVVKAQQGLLPEKAWGAVLSGYDTRLIRWLRNELDRRVKSLGEKFNDRPGGYYFGYNCGEAADKVYVYVKKRKLVVDVKIDPERAASLRSLGFTVSLRQNWQGRAGWLTGWDIPYDMGWDNRQAILETILRAF